MIDGISYTRIRGTLHIIQETDVKNLQCEGLKRGNQKNQGTLGNPENRRSQKNQMKCNQGEVSVYLCLTLGILLTLVLVIYYGCTVLEGKVKAMATVDSAAYSLKGDYQAELFERYHILAIDETYDGRGEAYMEQRVHDYLDYNLNGSTTSYAFTINDVAVTDKAYLVEEGLEGFNSQLQDYMEEKLVVDVSKSVFDEMKSGSSASEKDGEIETEKVEKEALDLDFSSSETDSASQSDNAASDNQAKSDKRLSGEDMDRLGLSNLVEEKKDSYSVQDLLSLDLTENSQFVDPRKSMNILQGSGILEWVIPSKAASVSKAKIDLTHVPSKSLKSSVFSTTLSTMQMPDFSTILSNDQKFDWTELVSNQNDFTSIVSETMSGALGDDQIADITYAFDSFTAYQNDWHVADDGENHTYEYEIEYLLEGKASDYENLSKVAQEIFAIRLAANCYHAFTDSTMKGEAEVLATVICVATYTEEFIEPLTYTFLGCWAFGESIYDVSRLLNGDRVAVVKTNENWKLSLNGLLNMSVSASGGDDEGFGLTYEEYLAVLLAMKVKPETLQYRMLDLMELNIQQEDENFEIENCIYSYAIDTDISTQGQHFYLISEESYLEDDN